MDKFEDVIEEFDLLEEYDLTGDEVENEDEN